MNRHWISPDQALLVGHVSAFVSLIAMFWIVFWLEPPMPPQTEYAIVQGAVGLWLFLLFVAIDLAKQEAKEND